MNDADVRALAWAVTQALEWKGYYTGSDTEAYRYAEKLARAKRALKNLREEAKQETRVRRNSLQRRLAALRKISG